MGNTTLAKWLELSVAREDNKLRKRREASEVHCQAPTFNRGRVFNIVPRHFVA